MYLMYADESGNTGTDYDNKEQPIFVLAGVLIEDKKHFSISKGYKKYSVTKEEHCLNMYNKLNTLINPIESKFLTKYIPLPFDLYYI